MPIARLPARNQRRTLFAAFCVISGLAFMLGQGVAAYQATILQSRIDSLVPQAQEQVSIAHGVTPTPTVHTLKGAVTVYATKKHTSTTRTTTLALAPHASAPTAAPTTDAKGDGHEHGKQDKPGHDDHGKHKGKIDVADNPKESGHSDNAGNSGSAKDAAKSDEAAQPDASATTDAAGQTISITTPDKNNAAHP